MPIIKLNISTEESKNNNIEVISQYNSKVIIMILKDTIELLERQEDLNK